MNDTSSLKEINSKIREHWQLYEGAVLLPDLSSENLSSAQGEAYGPGDLEHLEWLAEQQSFTRPPTPSELPIQRISPKQWQAAVDEMEAELAIPFEHRSPDRTQELPLNTVEFQNEYRAARLRADQSVQDDRLPQPEDDLEAAREELYQVFDVIRSELRATGRSATELRLLGRIGGLEDWLANERAEFLAMTRAAAKRPAPATSVTAAPKPEPEPESDEIPHHLLKPGGFLGLLIDWYLDQSWIPQPEFALSAAIATLATLTGQKIAEPSGERSNLFLINLGESSSGKEGPADLTEKVLVAAGMKDRILSRAASGAGLLSALRKQAVRLFSWDELGISLKSLTDSRAGSWQREIVSHLLSLFTRAGGVYRGVAYADGEHDAAKEIHNPHLVLLGSSTPSTFYDSLTDDAVESGLLGRCLVFMGNPKQLANRGLVRESVPPVIALQATAWDNRARSAGNLAGVLIRPIEFRYDADARAHLDDWGIRLENRKVALTGWRRAMLGRAEQIGKRLALIHAASLGPDSAVITLESVKWGAELAEFLTNRLARHAEEKIGATGYEKNMDKLIEFIAERGSEGASRRELSRAFRRFKVKEIIELLTHAIEAGRVAIKPRELGMGRPSEVFVATGG